MTFRELEANTAGMRLTGGQRAEAGRLLGTGQGIVGDGGIPVRMKGIDKEEKV